MVLWDLLDLLEPSVLVNVPCDSALAKPDCRSVHSEAELELESCYLTTLYSCDDCQRRVPISCLRRQASDPWLTLKTVGESDDGAVPGPLPDVGSSVM